MVAELIQWANAQGYALTFGEAYRTPEQAAWDAAHGTGIKNSLHTLRLAVDFNLFVNGVYQTGVEAYRPLGNHWRSKGGSWGGDWTSGDANHFSLSYGGLKEVMV
jgi:D-alanyl-D-alanine carboxypeptidase